MIGSCCVLIMDCSKDLFKDDRHIFVQRSYYAHMKLVVRGDPRCTDRRYPRSRGKCKFVCVKNYWFNSRMLRKSSKA
ncbi:hypothetical protein VPH35_134864 [Triticum aestivum]